MKIFLLHLFERFSRGGISSFNDHLYIQLLELGYHPILVKLKITQQFQDKESFPILYLSHEEIVEICHDSMALITFCSYAENHSLVKRLILMGIPIVIHDPVEYYPELLSLASTHSGIITIRKKNQQNLAEMGHKSTFIHHPYNPVKSNNKSRNGSVSCSRLSYCKGIELLIQANELNSGIDMYGEMNKDYFLEYLSKEISWRRFYKGEIENNLEFKINLFSRYNYFLDMSVITMDGGGSQYSFLEAWNSGCILIINESWLLNDDEMIPGVNCLIAKDGIQIAEIIKSGKGYDTSIHESYLEKHNAQNSGMKFLEFILLQNQKRKGSHPNK
ncbi:hypothetical protein UFOVP386_9 [uncultured Caudovirales phage]|uniref:Uncharacterized protein n=1 Tax=uncultured Caudovirales phage TaxID=2100421 RepID=A0A6J7X6B1_9CAUD|nr:hypothetical protein UFOVP386_9 [uncultured Caudovirales phage]